MVKESRNTFIVILGIVLLIIVVSVATNFLFGGVFNSPLSTTQNIGSTSTSTLEQCSFIARTTKSSGPAQELQIPLTSGPMQRCLNGACNLLLAEVLQDTKAFSDSLAVVAFGEYEDPTRTKNRWTAQVSVNTQGGTVLMKSHEDGVVGGSQDVIVDLGNTAFKDDVPGKANKAELILRDDDNLRDLMLYVC